MGVEVVNKNRGGVGVYIGRGSIFGNPFRIGEDGNREEVIEKYRQWFLEKISDPSFRRAVWALEGKKIGLLLRPAALSWGCVEMVVRNGRRGSGLKSVGKSRSRKEAAAPPIGGAGVSRSRASRKYISVN